MRDFDRFVRAVAIVAVASIPCPGAAFSAERPPAVAGAFYPAERHVLEAAVRALLAEARLARPERPIALVAPHAGYRYSGQIAADAWRQAMGGDYDVIVILGTNHTVPPFDGVSVYRGAGYRTPLGLASIDRDVANALWQQDPVRFAHRPDAEESEHSVEVQVPFVQIAFPGKKILAAIVGRSDASLCARFGRALARALKGRRPLIVASSDLSHFPAYEDAVAADHGVLASVATVQPQTVQQAIDAEMRKGRPGLETSACGEGPILAALEAARQLGATRASVISYANSGDTALGDRSRVVGYGAVSITGGGGGSDTSALNPPPGEPARSVTTREGRQALLAFARETIERALRTETFPLARNFPPDQCRNQGAFVTLRKHGELRGCVGHWPADRPVGQVVGAMALQAAFNDHRFLPVEAEELSDIEIEISLLSPLERVQSVDELKLGRDGVYMRKEGRSAIFLPEVAVQQGWTRDEMLDQLSRKAGLEAGAWRTGTELYRFQSESFQESDFREPPIP